PERVRAARPSIDEESRIAGRAYIERGTSAGCKGRADIVSAGDQGRYARKGSQGVTAHHTCLLQKWMGRTSGRARIVHWRQNRRPQRKSPEATTRVCTGRGGPPLSICRCGG